MNEQHSQTGDVEDISMAGREGRAVQPARSYQIEIGDEHLQFRKYALDDPVPLGRQILTVAGYDATPDCSVFAILKTGDFEDIRLDEAVDLRERGIERFVIFHTDREFKLTVKGDLVQWGKPVISGAILYKLANIAEDEALYLDVPGGEDRLIEEMELIDLSAPGVERFIAAPRQPTTFEITVNARPRIVLSREVTFEQVVQLVFPGTHEPNVCFSMTYCHAASVPHAGELGPGGSVQVKRKGTVFNVTRTVKS